MAEITKNVKKVHISKEDIETLLASVEEKELYARLQEIEETVELSWENRNWIKVKIDEEYSGYCNREYGLLFPDPDKFLLEEIPVGSKFYLIKRRREFCGFPVGDVLKEQIIKEICFNDKKSPFYKKSDLVICKVENKSFKYGYFDGNATQEMWNGQENATYAYKRMFGTLSTQSVSKKVAIYLPAFEFDEKLTWIENILKYKLVPASFDKKQEQLLTGVQALYHDGWFLVKDGRIVPSAKAQESINKHNTSQNKEILEKLGVQKRALETLALEVKDQENFLRGYLNCDKERINLEPYDVKRMMDPNQGHWELWKEEREPQVETKCSFVARNPLADVKKNGIVGIDFGTKSTIVVYQDGRNDTQIMRIGTGDLTKEITDTDYENPTVMEFRNWETFLGAYKAKRGRPYTKWNDLTISHTAEQSLKDSENGYSFFNDLKQWAQDNMRLVKIRDKQNYEWELGAYLDMPENEEPDPIEIYAYYIGMFINNMTRGIYLKYLLSFPVTYEKAVREKIRTSFERGLKKSLPEEVLDDAESMKNFEVMQGASEPAAYAICALEQYGFEPTENEKIFYGIFDFGGGTTDFDFGIWQGTDDDNEDYDYVIKHFGAAGDKFLGGENLLERLAYDVFCKNIELCRKEEITFRVPAGMEVPEKLRAFISDSSEAKMNMKHLMEKLRPIWEESNSDTDTQEKQKDEKNDGSDLLVSLFNRQGERKQNLEMKYSVSELKKRLEEEIEKGIRNFFESLKQTFTAERVEKEIGKIDQIHIFLAGNSSKSPIVKEIFERYKKNITKDILKKAENNGKEFFVVYPPLGTEEAKKLQEERGVNVNYEKGTMPTGKTGVAFGLLEGRNGGRIQVISEVTADTEAAFAYYLGIEKRKKFLSKIPKSAAYGVWHRLCNASKEEIMIYYTSLPEGAKRDALPIREVRYEVLRIDQIQPEASVYIRFVKPTVIECAVAENKHRIDKKRIVKLELVED